MRTSIVAAFLVIATLGCGSGGGDSGRPSPTPTDAPTPSVEPTPTPEPTPIATATARARLFVLADAEPDALVSKRLIFSDDLGETWQVPRGSGLSNDAVAFAFADREHGVAVGGSLAQRTSDGGRTWTTQLADDPAQPTVHNVASAVTIEGAGTAVVFGGEYGDGAPFRYASWQLPPDGSAPRRGSVEPPPALPTPIQFQPAIQSMCISADGTGVAAGRALERVGMTFAFIDAVFTTADHGASWTFSPSVSFTAFVGWSGTACVGANQWLVGVYPAQGLPVFHSADGGATWMDQSKYGPTIPGGLVGGLSAVAFVDERTGWAVGGQSRSIIVHTADGDDWTVQAIPANVNGIFNDIAFLDESLGLVGGLSSNGLVLITDDGGVNWRQLDLPSGLGNVLRVGLAR